MLGQEQRAALEAELAEACNSERFDAAAHQLIRGYGPELASFLGSMLRTPDDAGEAFQVFCEEMWKSLPKFRQESSFRTWSYSIARHTALRHLRSPHQKASRQVPLSSAPEVAELAQQVRTSTVNYLKTEVKDRVTQLRESLEPEEQLLFVLRLNRKMSWTDIVRVVDGESAPPAEEKKRATILRKRFQRAKDKLRELVEQDTFLTPPPESSGH